MSAISKLVVVLGFIVVAVALLGGVATAQSVPTSCATGEWLSKYYSGKAFNTLKVTRCEASSSPQLNKNWGSGSITPMGRADSASARWTGTFNLGPDGGTFDFTATADDGIRVYVDGVNIINEWRDQAATTFTARKDLTGGNHTVRVDYYENTGDAVAKVGWARITEPPPPPPPGDCPTSAPAGYITSSGSPNDEIATGQDVFIPGGNYSASTFSLAGGQDVVGAGKASTTINVGGNGVDANNSNYALRCLTLNGPGVGSGTTGMTVGSGSGGLLSNAKLQNYKFPIRARSQPMPQLDILNSDFANFGIAGNAGYGFYGNLRDSEVSGNNFEALNGYASMEFQAVNNVEVHHNTFTGGVTCVKALADYPFSKAGFNGFNVHDNTCTGFSEEGLSTDTRANQPQNTMREIDEVSSASGNQVVLQDGGWSGSQYGDGNHYMSFYTGACRGVPIKIAAQSGRTFTLASPPCLPAPNDLAMVGVPFLNIHFDNNTVDASSGLRGIDFWGYTYNSTANNNKVEGPTTTDDPNKKAIGLISLAGYTTTGSSIPAPCGKAASVDGITVSGNTDIDGSLKANDVVFVSTNKWSCQPFYLPRLNNISGNTLPTVTQNIQW